MKIYLTVIISTALMLQACVQEPTTSGGSGAASAFSAAQACETVIEAGDDMKYNKAEINISKSCKEYTITLKHMGTMPKAAMGHNFVIAESEDVGGVAADGAEAGIENDFIKAGDERVIANIKLIGSGEEAAVKVDTDRFSSGSKYEFFCTFPGRLAVMRGTVNLVD